MKNSHALLAGLAGTTAMTIFSYLVSEKKKKNFKEPYLIGKLADDFLPEQMEGFAKPIGALAHYAVGYAWSAGHLYVLERAGIRPSLGNALLTGPVYGLLGALIWKAHFSAHPHPPKIDYRRYYGHLLLAHTVFTIVVNLTARKLMERK